MLAAPAALERKYSGRVPTSRKIAKGLLIFRLFAACP